MHEEKEGSKVPKAGNKQNNNATVLTRARGQRTVLVKNLPRSYNRHKIRKLFSDCGNILCIDTVLSPDKTNRYARLEFSSPDEAASALTRDHKQIGANNVLEVSLLQNNTLWMTNFPPTFTPKELREELLNRGIVCLSVRFPSHRYNSNRRFAYVDVCSIDDKLRAIESLNESMLGGYKLIVRDSDPSARVRRTDAGSIERREIFIRNLDPECTTKETLMELVKEYGEIECINIPHTRENMVNACAFVTFVSRDDALKAVAAINNQIFKGRKISVALADSKAYLEREEVKKILNSQNPVRLSSVISLFPISDRTSKEQVELFIVENSPVSRDDIQRVFLVTDYSGSLVIFRDQLLAAKCSLALSGRIFQNRVITCGSVQDLKLSRRKPHKVGNNNNNNNNPELGKTNQRQLQSHIIQSEATKPMTNDDIRELFLGKK